MSDIKIVDSGIQIAEESDIKFADEPRPKKASPWDWLKNLSGKVFRKGSFEKPSLETSSPVAPITSTAEETPVLDNDDPKEPEEIMEQSLSQIAESGAGQDPETSLQPETTEKVLRPANKIFFQTTLSQNIADIRQTGLIARENRDVIGRSLGYSLTFPSEFNLPEGRRIVAFEANRVNDFSLMIWRASADIKKIKDKEGRVRSGQFGAAKKLEPGQPIPQGYLDSRAGGVWDRTADPKKLRKIDPANFLAAIPIDQNVQETLTRCKIEFAYDLADADTIEERLVEFLDDPERHLQLSQGYTTQTLAHDLMARIQQEVLVDRTKIVAEDLLNRVENSDLSLSNSRDLIVAEVEEILAKALKVNEPVSSHYLKAWEKKLEQVCEEKGIVLPTHTDVEAAKRSSILKRRLAMIIHDPYALWGDNDSCKIAVQVAAKMGITL